MAINAPCATRDGTAGLLSPGVPRQALLDPRMPAHLGFHARPALLLLLPSPHVLVLLLGLRHGLKELIEDAEELVGLYFVRVFSKVLHGLGKLGREQTGGCQAGGKTHMENLHDGAERNMSNGWS